MLDFKIYHNGLFLLVSDLLTIINNNMIVYNTHTHTHTNTYIAL